MKYIIEHRTVILIILVILLSILICFLASEVSNLIDVKKKEKVLKTDFESFIAMVKTGDTFNANMMFEENSKNNLLKYYTTAPDKSKILEVGYVEYIQRTDYMLEYYKKFKIKILKVKELKSDTAKITVRAERPDYLKHMDECDAENVDNPDYNFNKAFIEKINSDKVKFITGEFEINFVKVDGNWRLTYSDQMKEMLYGVSETDEQGTTEIEE